MRRLGKDGELPVISEWGPVIPGNLPVILLRVLPKYYRLQEMTQLSPQGSEFNFFSSCGFVSIIEIVWLHKIGHATPYTHAIGHYIFCTTADIVLILVHINITCELVCYCYSFHTLTTYKYQVTILKVLERHTPAQ